MARVNLNQTEIQTVLKLETKVFGKRNMLTFAILYPLMGIIFARGLEAPRQFFITFLILFSVLSLASVMFSRDPKEFLFINMTNAKLDSYVTTKNIFIFIYSIISLVLTNTAFSLSLDSETVKSAVTQPITTLIVFFPYMIFFVLSIGNRNARINLLNKRKTGTFFQNLISAIILGATLAAFIASRNYIGILFTLVILLPLSICIYLLSLISTIEKLERDRKTIFEK